jgi:hypothetical protein
MSLRTVVRLSMLSAAALLGVMAVPAAVASATPSTGSKASPYVCTGGNVPPGTYKSMVVTGICTMNTGNVVIRGNLTIASGALLDAVTPGDPAATATTTPTVPAVVTVGGNVRVGHGAVLLLGCSPNISCGPPSPGITYDRVGGSLTAFGAQGVVVHSASIGGSVSVVGGGGGSAADTCAAQTAGQPVVADLEPWSQDPALDFTPVYTDFEDVSVGGSLTIAGLNSCWLGSLRDQVRGNVTVAGNKMGDPDAMEVDNNLIKGNIACFNNVPAVQFGDGNSAANLVGGRASGECAFRVILPNPAPEAIASGGAPGPSVPEHISVRLQSLKTYFGTDTETQVGSLPTVTTSAGDTITADLYNFVLKGHGLTGSGTFSPTIGPGLSGQTVLSTTFPNGFSKFTVYLVCNPCTFKGQTGSVSLRAYGTTTPKGVSSGTFLVTSGGGTPTSGALATVVGWGTFSTFGQPQGTVRLVEHLGNAA